MPTKKKQPKWIKPSNSNLSQFGEDNKIELKTPEPIHNRDKDDPTSGPGVSKFAIIQMIQDGSNRIHFEESQTHSAVWEKFLKIVLDNSEVPFVCCKYCKKVYTHDNNKDHKPRNDRGVRVRDQRCPPFPQHGSEV